MGLPGRSALDAPDLPGATALRALATVLSRHGERTMLAIYDRAAVLRPGRAVVDATVTQLLTPSLPTTPHPGAARDEPVDEDKDRDEDPEAVHELHDRLIEIRRVLDDLGAVTAELGATGGRREAQRILDDLRGEVDQLPDALAAAIASRDSPVITR